MAVCTVNGRHVSRLPGTAVRIMIPGMSRLFTALACALAGAAPSTAGAASDSGSPADSTRSPEELILPAALQDIDGREVDLAGLVRRRQVVFVTMKGPWCGVCKRQLGRLRRIQSKLNQCGAAFVVLSARAAKGDLRGQARHRLLRPLRRGRRSEARSRPRPAAGRGPDPAGHLRSTGACGSPGCRRAAPAATTGTGPCCVNSTAERSIPSRFPDLAPPDSPPRSGPPSRPPLQGRPVIVSRCRSNATTVVGSGLASSFLPGDRSG